ncbi:MAG: asparagine synthase (glutamine-hydrolyzing), partial [Candidatus Komeilibacteria bacterium]|nr:asparagine synthase (glutamine-hydrolyzing) [Candidatus Komeilibacteria bacterium]
MCGIAGFAGSGNQDTLARMVAAVRHRGPDDQGFFLDNQVGLGFARLSIIDLSPTGHQPMTSADGNATIIFNGEIYNYRELKSELLQKNSYPFRGTSDTEVLLALYQIYGIDFLKKINGMFALALYDKRNGSLFLTRDRMGKKPLYYTVIGGTLIFGSEPKALLQHPACVRKLNLTALNDYLHYEYVPTPYSIFEGISKLEPAHSALWQQGKLTTHPFWSMDFTEKRIAEADALKKLDAELQRSVAQRLVADVPLGIFLSGGLDSSTIAYYAQKASTQKIKTYSIGFKESSFDESAFARMVAEHLGTDHHEQILSAKDSLELIPHIADLLDEPMADPSIIPTYLLSKFTREHVTVALGGDGGDELFAGYPTFQAFKLAHWYRKLPETLRRLLLEPALSLIPASERDMSLGFLVRRFIAGT